MFYTVFTSMYSLFVMDGFSQFMNKFACFFLPREKSSQRVTPNAQTSDFCEYTFSVATKKNHDMKAKSVKFRK